ncbi:DUF4198 domain-containing protein [Lysobacter sp. Root690]|uniref:DUF4198 domain-containing protein n=1 Tax=Lysobacter sp. Root690 TaxID=1736588 RepID=UPI0009E9337D|nr:DUF4198 domain-containing protein [Lysobacter sp. Root690]
MFAIDWLRRVRSQGARITLAMSLLSLAASAQAHDFWIQPERYRIAPDTPTALTLQVGHGADRQRSKIGVRRITHFAAVSTGGSSIDLRERLHPGEASDGTFQLPAGGYMLVLETDARAQSHLPAIRFNDYLQAEGLTPALQHRQRNGRMQAEGLENYSRRSKAIVRVGPSDAMTSAQWRALLSRPLGLPLEIVLDQDPYAQPRPSRLPLRVIYEGRTLAGALVKLTRLEDDAQPFATQYTDADGRADFAMPTQGRWLLNVIWTKPLPASSETDYETVFSSLSFELDDARR